MNAPSSSTLNSPSRLPNSRNWRAGSCIVSNARSRVGKEPEAWRRTRSDYSPICRRRRGKCAESTANLEKAASLDPKSNWPLQNLVFNYEMTRDYAKANETVDRALAIDPKSFPLLELKSMLAIQEKGDFTIAEKALAMVESLPKDADKSGKIGVARINILLFQRKFAEALRAAESLSDDASGWESSAYHSKNVFIGIAKKKMGDEAG